MRGAFCWSVGYDSAPSSKRHEQSQPEDGLYEFVGALPPLPFRSGLTVQPSSRLFSIADFRRLWFIGLAICVVRWLEMLALALFAYQLTASAFVVAMLTMLRMLPMGLFGAFLGAAAERFDRRAADPRARRAMAVTLTLAILASLDAIEVWHLAVASFMNGIGWVSDHPGAADDDRRFGRRRAYRVGAVDRYRHQQWDAASPARCWQGSCSPNSASRACSGSASRSTCRADRGGPHRHAAADRRQRTGLVHREHPRRASRGCAATGG